MPEMDNAIEAAVREVDLMVCREGWNKARHRIPGILTSLLAREREAAAERVRGGEESEKLMNTLFRLSVDMPSSHYAAAYRELRRIRDQFFPPFVPREEAKPSPAPGEGAIEIRRNPDDSLDEVVVKGADVHLEQMSEGAWWVCVSKGREEVRVCLHATRRITATVEPPAQPAGEREYIPTPQELRQLSAQFVTVRHPAKPAGEG